jgi:V/A-type H+-transporting ATPase subunit A
MLKVILTFYDRISDAMNTGVALNKILKLPLKAEIGRMKELKDVEKIKSLVKDIDKKVGAVEVER